MGICWYSSKANSKLLLERLIYHPDYLQRLRWMQIPGLLFLRHFVFFFLTTLSRKRFGLIEGFLRVLWRIAIRSSTRKGRNMCPGEDVGLSAGQCRLNRLGLVGMHLIRARSTWSCKLFKKELYIFNANERLPKNPWSLIVHGLYFSSSDNVSSIRCIH